jgi:hypothetical protein
MPWLRRPLSVTARSLFVVLLAVGTNGCRADSSSTPTTPPTTPTSPTPTTATIRIVYLAATTIRSDLPQSALGCARAEMPTHVHFSWRNYQSVDMIGGVDRWELTATDVPLNTRQILVIADPNMCVENMTGSVTRNVLLNDVRLTDIQTIPNTQPPVQGLGFSVAADGRVTP